MKDVRRLPYRSAPGLIPQELIDRCFKCPKCNSDVQVPWLEKMEFPKQPIQPTGGGGHFVPVSFPLTCVFCSDSFDARVTILKNESKWFLYGDEAGRYIVDPLNQYSQRPLNFFCITLVGMHNSKQNRLKKRINKIKRKIVPDSDPETWSHHFTKIWSSSPNSGEYNLRNKEEKIKHAKEFAKIIRQSRPELVTFNISGCLYSPESAKDRSVHINHQKQDVFAQSILTTLKQMRAHNKSVEWIFDNIKDTTDGKRTEGWAEECFLGLQYTPLFTWLSAGAAIVKPSFVEPGTHYLLEVADFISYCVAREFERSIRGKEVEFPSSLLGKGFYQGTIANGNVLYMWNNGLPLKKFYGIQNHI